MDKEIPPPCLHLWCGTGERSDSEHLPRRAVPEVEGQFLGMYTLRLRPSLAFGRPLSKAEI